MIQCGQNFCFALKAADACRLAGKLFRQDLDGDIAFELGVGRRSPMPPVPRWPVIS
jgi:hypothetical protein